MSKHSLIDNLRVIAEIATFEDTARVFGVPESHLEAVIQGRAKPHPDLVKYVAEVAGRIRRRDSQVKRYAQEDATRRARREIRDTLRLIGKPDLQIPDYLPPMLRVHESGRLNSPVFVYDFRKMNAERVRQFFQFMKHVTPTGAFFLTYNLVTPGIASGKEGMFFTDKLVDELKIIHKTKSSIKAIREEIGTASSGAFITKIKGGFLVEGISTVSTQYMDFCVPVGRLTCEVRSNNSFVELWKKFNDRSVGREVVECGISHYRPLTRTEAEIVEDDERGADPITGLVYLWEDE